MGTGGGRQTSSRPRKTGVRPFFREPPCQARRYKSRGGVLSPLPGLGRHAAADPTACAVGYHLAPLRGLDTRRAAAWRGRAANSFRRSAGLRCRFAGLRRRSAALTRCFAASACRSAGLTRRTAAWRGHTVWVGHRVPRVWHAVRRRMQDGQGRQEWLEASRKSCHTARQPLLVRRPLWIDAREKAPPRDRARGLGGVRGYAPAQARSVESW